jgi:5-oxoprolinase (ATP-hydrolysing)
VSDLQAQIAANQKGISLVNELAAEFGVGVVQKYMGYIQAAAESAVRELLKDVAARCAGGGGGGDSAVLKAVDYMDDGTPIRLSIEIDPNQKANPALLKADHSSSPPCKVSSARGPLRWRS